MKNILSLLALFICSLSSVHAQLYNVLASNEDSLYVMDANANVVEKHGITETNSNPISGYTGMAMNPTNSLTYVVVKATPRYLATFDESTNTITKIADLSDKISGITFNSQGILFGITGDGAANPNVLYMINTSTGALIQQADLSGVPGDDGESIGYNSTDDFIYRLAGGQYLYKIAPGSFTQTLVTDTLTNAGISGHALYYDGTNFISLTNWMCTMNSNGGQSNCTQLADDFKGIVARTVVGISPVEPTTFSMFPNPASNFLIVQRAENSTETVEITDGSGKLLKKGKLDSKTVKVDVSDLSAGIYFVTIGNEKQKLVIQ